MKITDLGLDAEIISALAEYENVDDLPDDLTTIKGVGAARAATIQEAIDAANMTDGGADGAGAEAVASGPELAHEGWAGDLEQGVGILRGACRGVGLKIVVGFDEDVCIVNAFAIDRHDRWRGTFVGDSALEEAKAACLDQAARLADSRPVHAERETPIANIKGASDEVLEHRLGLIGDPAGDLAKGKVEFRGEMDKAQAAIERLHAERTKRRQQWKETGKALQDLIHEQAAINHELQARQDKREKAERVMQTA